MADLAAMGAMSDGAAQTATSAKTTCHTLMEERRAPPEGSRVGGPGAAGGGLPRATRPYTADRSCVHGFARVALYSFSLDECLTPELVADGD